MTAGPAFGAAAGRPERLALRLLQLGTIAIVVSVAVLHLFELDRFFVPKELAFHLVAALAGLLSIRAVGRVHGTRVDRLLLIYLALTLVSSALATNHWASFRSFAISVSSLVIFWTARSLRTAGLGDRIVRLLAFGILLSSASALLQTYGVGTLLFSENRAPGGTLGNRNFVAHAAAFGWPLVIVAALTARRAAGYLFWSTGAALVTASLVLTRSRAAWLAFAAAVMIVLLSMLVSPALRRAGRWRLRLLGVLLLSGAAVAAALTVPNTLRWRSDNPYLESVQRVADFQEGSGRGRLVQYEQSLRMAAAHPLFGVGPGNWAVRYPQFAARNDPSLDDSEAGMTSNPWPSSDWVAFLSERGAAATALLLLALGGIVVRAFRQVVDGADREKSLSSAALLALTAAALIAGSFDAVLLLAMPSFFIWTALGTLWEPHAPSPDRRRVPVRFVFVLLVIISAVAAGRSAVQLTAMQMYATGELPMIRRAAQLDPGNYRIRLRLARRGRRVERCRHARAAHALLPHAEAARRLASRCRD